MDKWITLNLSVQLAKLFSLSLLVFAHAMKKKGEWLMLPRRILVLRFVKDVMKFFCTLEPEMSVLGILWTSQPHSNF